MLFREHVLSDVLPHLHNKNDNAHKLFFTSSQNSTFSLTSFAYSFHPFISTIHLHHIPTLQARTGGTVCSLLIYIFPLLTYHWFSSPFPYEYSVLFLNPILLLVDDVFDLNILCMKHMSSMLETW